MSDLIDRQAAINEIDEECSWLRGVFGRIEDRLMGLPSIDAEPIIRCKDCKWWKSSWKYCHYIHFDTDKNFYCAVGERRHDATFK